MSNSPNTLRAVESTQKSGRPLIFDPALKQFPDAFKLGDFVSASQHERLEWELVRSEVREHLLQFISQSRWKDHLVLRGSALMKVWFGEAARDPKDIDWVFQPQSVTTSDPECKQLCAEIIELVRQNPRTANTQILVDQIAMDSIWTYERAEGRRIVFPFQANDGGQREIQIDIVFGEEILEPPVLTSIPINDGQEISVLAATPELSLAWKLLWIATDSYPQGKDLYDAVLLAESVKLSFDLLSRTLLTYEYQSEIRYSLADYKKLYMDWDNFKLEFPWIEGDHAHWEARLMTALIPTFVGVK